MGAQQSSDRGGEASSAAPVARTCYYDLLGVERQATDDEIKKAYRRKALEFHPDRNYGDVENATRKFAEVQSAYEILSDPQERAWYDSHRDAILSGQDGQDGEGQPTTFRNVRLTTAEEIMGLMRRFNASIPFDDEPTGFYGISRETFEHLALEEEAAADYDDVDAVDYPTFGSSDDDYESVVKPFYAVWIGFSTKKSFSWKDKYRLSDAPDRRVRRLMEKENKKLRDDAIREFNDAVRFLVGFVRKRDPRYLPNTQTDAQRQESLRNAAAAQAAKARAANQEKLASFEVPDWAQARSDEDLGDDLTESEEESEVEILECVVCNKTFKSENQLEAHERSKKHTKAVQQLRRQMKREGADLRLDEVEPTSSPDSQSKVSTPKVVDTENGEESEEDSKAPQPKSKGTETPISAESLESSDVDDEYAPRDVVEERLVSKATDTPESKDTDDEISIATSDLKVDDSTPAKKIGKARAKREKKLAAAAKSQPGDVHQCSVCYNTYESRTQLFNHIRDEGHAALKQVSGGGGGGNKKKKKK